LSLKEQLNAEKAKVKQLESKVLLLEKANTHYAEQYDTLQKQIKDLLRHRFGSRSERFIDSNHPQDDLFCETDLPDTGDAPEETLPDNVVPITGRRKKVRRKAILRFLAVP
jgi:transposase